MVWLECLSIEDYNKRVVKTHQASQEPGSGELDSPWGVDGEMSRPSSLARAGTEGIKLKQLTMRHYVLAGLLGALMAVLGFTPLGMIPVPTPAGSATILHIPVILGALLEGPVFGGLVGFLFGAVSFWRALVAPANPVARIMFSDPFTAFLPRILIGVAAYYVFLLAKKKSWRPVISAFLGLLLWDLTYRVAVYAEWVTSSTATYLLFLPVGLLVLYLALRFLSGENAPIIGAALAGSLVNTIGVLTMVTLRGIIPPPAAAVVAVVHGLPEAMVAAVLCVTLYKLLQHRRGQRGA